MLKQRANFQIVVLPLTIYVVSAKKITVNLILIVINASFKLRLVIPLLVKTLRKEITFREDQ